MRRIFAILMIVAMVALAGCATDKATMCSNAQKGFVIANIALSTTQTPEAKTYWDKYLEGVKLIVETMCM